MMKKGKLVIFSVLLLMVSGIITAQEKPAVRLESLVGNWELKVDAGEMVISLQLTLALENDLLTGRISEAYGTFSGVPVEELRVEVDRLSFNLTVPSPPDGLTRTWIFELKVSGDEMEGIVYNNEVQISVPVRGRKSS